MSRPIPDTCDHWAQLTAEGVTMLPGSEPGTALRLRLEPCPRGGCVHIEQVAYSSTMGWYRQRSFSLPRSMVSDLSKLLRMSDCLLPPAADATPIRDADASLDSPLRLHPAPPAPHEAAPDSGPTHSDPQRRSG